MKSPKSSNHQLGENPANCGRFGSSTRSCGASFGHSRGVSSVRTSTAATASPLKMIHTTQFFAPNVTGDWTTATGNPPVFSLFSEYQYLQSRCSSAAASQARIAAAVGIPTVILALNAAIAFCCLIACWWEKTRYAATASAMLIASAAVSR